MDFFSVNTYYCCQTQVCVPDTWWGQTNQNAGVWSGERIIYCRAMQGEQDGSWSKDLNSPMGFREEVFIGKIWREVCRVCDFPLIGLWWGNSVVFQKSQPSAFWFQPAWGPHSLLSLKLPSSTWVGALLPVEELRDMCQIDMHIPLGGTRIRPHGCTVVSFCIPSLS